MLAVIYVRVSTEEQAKRGYSVPEQIAQCQERAAELGATETAVFVDELGGDFLERPELEKARQLVRAKQARWFICYDPDRFSRNLLNQLLVTDEIDKSGAELVFLQHNREKTAEGNLFYAIRGAIAEFEKKKILERTQRGKRGKAKRGLLPGYVKPYGYTMDTETDQLVIHDVEAAWVSRIFQWAAAPDPQERLTAGRIAQRLNEWGVPAPRGNHWYRSTVTGILRNPLYTGRLRWGQFDHTGIYQARRAGLPRPKRVRRPESQVVDLPVPPILSPDLFDRVQQYARADRSRRSRGSLYMLTGLVRCGLCGGHVQSKRAGARYLVCANRYPSQRGATLPCRLPHLKAELVEAFVWQTVYGWMQEPEAVQQALSPLPQPGPGAELDAVTRQIAELEQAQARILALVARARVKPEIAQRQIEEQAGQIERLTRLREDLALGAGGPSEELGLGPGDVPGLIRERLESLSPADRNLLVRRLVARVTLGGKEMHAWQVEPIILSPA